MGPAAVVTAVVVMMQAPCGVGELGRCGNPQVTTPTACMGSFGSGGRYLSHAKARVNTTPGFFIAPPDQQRLAPPCSIALSSATPVPLACLMTTRQGPMSASSELALHSIAQDGLREHFATSNLLGDLSGLSVKVSHTGSDRA
jgi:hypothetical protein